MKVCGDKLGIDRRLRHTDGMKVCGDKLGIDRRLRRAHGMKSAATNWAWTGRAERFTTEQR